eukprot:CAMPEP_0119292868 /NCGR_PEP_ID=MMETSP1329-20130426/45028_1 /TAXON_ID=114041 /ORGANISM="Genus nov. species nov., Strain RCC1024" /LENGTH=78 /DNA_ID=CAMNT_0007293719 /DNA_START=72 /DNA_END=304 /DNA_ORIENTATION=-
MSELVRSNALTPPQFDASAIVSRTTSEARSLLWRRAEKELSIGVEVETWLPDLRCALPDLRLLRTPQDLFSAVAEALS